MEPTREVVYAMSQLMPKVAELDLDDDHKVAIHEWYLAWLGEHWDLFMAPVMDLTDDEFESGMVRTEFNMVVEGEFNE